MIGIQILHPYSLLYHALCLLNNVMQGFPNKICQQSFSYKFYIIPFEFSNSKKIAKWPNTVAIGLEISFYHFLFYIIHLPFSF